MAIINVYLAELCSDRCFRADEKAEIYSNLTNWFRRICHGSSYTSNVVWANSAPAVSPTDLICYFLPSELESLLQAVGAPTNLRESHGKTYISSTGTLSEVYVARCRLNQTSNVNWISQIAFHELMHNKLGLSDIALHTKNGLASLSNLRRGIEPTDANISDMRRHLSVQRPQWTGGWGSVNCNIMGNFRI